MSDNKETKTEILRVRLTKHYRDKLKAFAQKRGLSESRAIQEYIRRLPSQ